MLVWKFAQLNDKWHSCSDHTLLLTRGGLPNYDNEGEVYMNYTGTNPAYTDLDPTRMTADNLYASLSWNSTERRWRRKTDKCILVIYFISEDFHNHFVCCNLISQQLLSTPPAYNCGIFSVYEKISQSCLSVYAINKTWRSHLSVYLKLHNTIRKHKNDISIIRKYKIKQVIHTLLSTIHGITILAKKSSKNNIFNSTWPQNIQRFHHIKAIQ